MENLIDLKNISKSYVNKYGDYKALEKVNLMVKKGEFLAVLGASGSGKTTLMNILGFLDTADSGKYLFKNKEFKRLSPNDRAEIRSKNIGYIFQSFNLLSDLSARENVELPLFYSKVKKKNQKAFAFEALKTVGLETKINNKPNELSGGQKQRVAIARAIVTNPEIILADEPTGNLDKTTAIEIMNLLTKLNKMGKTIILITHDSECSNYASRKVYINNGKLYENFI